MDWWTRLIGGLSNTPKKEAISNDPHLRLDRFKRANKQFTQHWDKIRSLPSESSALELLRVYLHRMTSTLLEECRSPSPHLCLSFAASTGVYSQISRIAEEAREEIIIREVVALFAALVDSEEDGFVNDRSFSSSLLHFVGQIASAGGVAVGEETEGEVMELLFGIAAKIRLQPTILPIWFSHREERSNNSEYTVTTSSFVGNARKEAFPLCYYLIDHVHHGGRIGDFARTGLLYIFETASKSEELEQWIVGSDLPTLMASGLGALYSQLSRKITTHRSNAPLPLVLALSDYSSTQKMSNAESIFSPEYESHLDTFLSYLAFWQDVLEHCRSTEVRQTLLGHFQILFLQQLLYPSVLESSDVDGGSSVAVLTYLRSILACLNHSELVEMILRYLLALVDPLEGNAGTVQSLAAKHHKSLAPLNGSRIEEGEFNPSLFNLVDFILTSAESPNVQTVGCALRLAAVIISKNHYHVVDSFPRTRCGTSQLPQRTVDALHQEIEAYLASAIIFGGEAGVDAAFGEHLNDALEFLESHGCSSKLSPISSANCSSSVRSYRNISPASAQNFLAAEEPLFKSLLGLLSCFLFNDVEINLALTETFASLASCSQVRVDGWLATDPLMYFHHKPLLSKENPPIEPFRALDLADQHPTLAPELNPIILQHLRLLEEQVTILREEIPNLTYHINNRKQAFKIHEEISDAMTKSSTNRPPPIISASTEMKSHKQVSRNSTSMADGSSSSSTSSPLQSDQDATERRSGISLSAPSPNQVAGTATLRPPYSARHDSQSLPLHKSNPQMAIDPSDASLDTSLVADIINSASTLSDNEVLQRRIVLQSSADDKLEVKVLPLPSSTTLARDNATDSSVTAAKQMAHGSGDIKGATKVREASLNHILTNMIMLQDFVLELVALLHVRSTLFNEVSFSV